MEKIISLLTIILVFQILVKDRVVFECITQGTSRRTVTVEQLRMEISHPESAFVELCKKEGVSTQIDFLRGSYVSRVRTHLARHILVISFCHYGVLFENVADELRCYSYLNIAALSRLWFRIDHLR
jgi:hypothetical protein